MGGDAGDERSTAAKATEGIFGLRSRRVVVERKQKLEVVPATLWIDGDRILGVQRDDGTLDRKGVAGPEAAPVEDLGDRLLTPAFVNAHSHLALVFARGFDPGPAVRGNRVEELFFRLESALQPGDVLAFATVGAYESVLAGVGTVWDHYYAGSEVAAAMARVGLAGVVAPTLQDLAGPGAEDFQDSLQETMDIHEDEELRRLGVRAALGPHATDTVSDVAWRELARLAESESLLVHAHLAQSPEEVERAQARWGRDPLAGLAQLGVLDRIPRGVWAHAIYLSRRSLTRLPPDHTLVACPRAQSHFGLPARVDAWAEAGVRWSVASDAAAGNDTMDPRGELPLIAAMRSLPASWSAAAERMLEGHGRSDELAAATWRGRDLQWSNFEALVEPASLLRRVWSIPGGIDPSHPTGNFAAGARADVLVWELEHPNAWPATDPLQFLVHGNAAPCVWRMMSGGRWRSEGGAHLRSIVESDAWRAASREAKRRLELLRERCH